VFQNVAAEDRLNHQVGETERQTTDLNEGIVQVHGSCRTVGRVLGQEATEESTNKTDVRVGPVIPAPVTASPHEERAGATHAATGLQADRLTFSLVPVTNFSPQTSAKTQAAVRAGDVEEARTESVAYADVIDGFWSRRKIRCLCAGHCENPCSADKQALEFHVPISKF